MKKLRWPMLVAAAFVLAACGGKDEGVTTAPNEAPTEQGNNNNNNDNNNNNNNNNAMTDNNQPAENALFDFTDFSLDVQYSDTESYEVDYDNEQSGVEASIEELDNNKITGDEAYKQLEPIFANFTFDANTPEDQVVAEVLKAFDLKENYKEFDLEIQYADGTEKEYNVTK